MPWFSRVARALLAANGGVAVGAEKSLRGVATACYGRSAPVEDAIPWGDVESWAAKLFSINLICTTFLVRAFFAGAGFAFGSAGVVLAVASVVVSAIWALPKATECIR